MRIIDADKLKIDFYDEYETEDDAYVYRDEFKNFDRESLILLIEVQKERIGELLADRPQGKWIDAEIPLESGDTMPIQVCNLCKTFYPLAYTGGGHRFCPNCGAKMDGEREGE